MSTNKTFENFRKLETEKYPVSFDITTVLKNAVGSNQWKSKDGLWTLISASMTDFSSQIFQRINNYAKNIMDVDTCQVTALKSIAESVDLPQITQFIKDIYPNFLNSLINTFSIDYKLLLNAPETKFKIENNTYVSNLQFLNASKFLSTGAVAKFFGSIDQRNKYTFPTESGYSEIFLLDILQNLDKIKYLLEKENNINFSYSAWSYISQKNRLQVTTLNTKYLFLNDFHQTENPSLNQIFTQLQFYKNLYNNTIIQNPNNPIKQDQEEIEIKAIYNYYNKYIGTESTYLFKKQEILKRCAKILVAKNIKKYREYYATFGISQIDHLQSILYYWTPYDINIINQSEKYILINNYNFTENTKIVNPFLILIAIFKNLAFNQKQQKLMKMSYTEEITNTYVDLTNIILHAVETIQTDELSYYYSMIVFHFYGVLYDNIFNNFLKSEWNINQNSSKTVATYIGKYSEYTKDQFIQLIKNYLSADQLDEFLLNGPTYYNHYHVDFIKSISILNSIISYGVWEKNNTEKLSYYIPYYNNDINIYKRQSYLYDNSFYKYKQKLFGVFYNFCTCAVPEPSNINNNVCSKCEKIIDNQQITDNFSIKLTESYIYKAALIFADYCIKIKNARQTLKSIVQQYARIGTSNLLNDIICDYFYKQFSKRQSWLLKDTASQSYDELSTFNLFLDILDLKKEDNGNQFKVAVQEYYDNTNYLNIYASSLISSLASTYVNVNVSTIIDNAIITSDISSQVAYKQISTYVSSITPSTYTSSCVQVFIDPNIYNKYIYENKYAGTTQSFHYISTYTIEVPITTYTSGIGYVLSTILSTYTTYIPNNNIPIDVNMPFWNSNGQIDEELFTDEKILNECKFYEQYFPELKNAYTDINKINVFKNTVYPLLIAIWNMHAVSGFSGELSDLNNYYSGVSGKYKIENLTNSLYPTIAPAENIENLFEQNEINNYKSAYLIRTYYQQLESYASSMYADLFNNTTHINTKIEKYSNYYYISAMFGILANGKFSENNNYHGYISNYENTYKISNDILKIQADGPWKYTFLQKFIQLSLNEIDFNNTLYKICDIDQIQSSLISSNYDYIMDDTKYASFSAYKNKITTTELKETQNFPQSLHNLSYNKYTKIYPYYEEYIKSTYSLLDFNITNNLITEINKLIIFTPAIIRLQNYKIADYKQDYYNNHYILFKHYNYDKYEDAGQIWVRYKNKPVAMPFMKSIKFLSQTNSYYNKNTYELDIDLFLTEYDQVKCAHPTYTKIIKQMVNNAIYFNIFNDFCVVVGYTNFIKYNTTFEKNNDFQYLKTVVFKLVMIDDQLTIDSTSIKFITTHEDNDYLLNINEFIGAFQDKNSENINIVLYNINKNNINTNIIKQNNNSVDNTFLNDISIQMMYVIYDINNFMLTYTTKTYSHVKYPIIGLYTNNICIDTKSYEYYISSVIPAISCNMSQSIWKIDDTQNTFAIGYESVSNSLLENKNVSFFKGYDIIYKNIRSYIDILLIKCDLIYKNINNTVLPVLNKINISLDKDYLDDFKDFNIISGNSTELNAIYSNYPKITINDNRQLIIKVIPLTFGGIKNFAQNIINDYTGIQLMQKLVHFNSDTSSNGVKQIFALQPSIYIPDFKYGLKELVYEFRNNKELFNRTNIGDITSATYSTVTQDNILSTIYTNQAYNLNYNNNYNNGLTFNLDLINNYNANLYKITSNFIKFLPNIANSILDDMKIIINFGSLTTEIKQFLTGTQSFDLDISVYIDDSEINGTEHFKKVGWHCGYTNTDYIDWDSNDNRYGGPEIITIHLKKYYMYLYKKYASNKIYNNPIFLEKNIIQHTKDVKLVINICWYNESSVISINPNMEIVWNGIYYKKVINKNKINFNIGCCENSFQQVLHLDLLNNSFTFKEKEYYKVTTIYNTLDNTVMFMINTQYYDIYKMNSIIPADETQIINNSAYIETYKFTENYIIRNWYIFNINKIISNNENIAIEDSDIIQYFKNCLTYLYYESFGINPSITITGKGIISCNLNQDINHNITKNNTYISILSGNTNTYTSTYFSTDTEYITSIYNIKNDLITGYLPNNQNFKILKTNITEISAGQLSTCMYEISSIINTYPYKMQYLNYKTIYDSNNSKNIITGLFQINPIYKQNYIYGYYFDNNITKTKKYSYGNIFANKINISANFNWQNINSNIFINNVTKSYIISNDLLSSNILQLNNKNEFYNQNISAGIIIKNHDYDTKLKNNIGINQQNVLTGNLWKTNKLTEGNYQITLSPYYKVKDKIIFLQDLQYSFNYNYYPNILTYIDKFNKTFNGNEFDIIHTYFIGDKILNSQLTGNITPELKEMPINIETKNIDYSKLVSTDIYYYKDTFNLYKNYMLSSDNETVTGNIEYNYSFPIMLYKYNTETSNLYLVGRLNYYNIYKTIYINPIINNNFIITDKTNKISFDLDIYISSLVINKYNGLTNYTDIEFSKYNTKNIIQELSANINYIFNN